MKQGTSRRDPRLISLCPPRVRGPTHEAAVGAAGHPQLDCRCQGAGRAADVSCPPSPELQTLIFRGPPGAQGRPGRHRHLSVCLFPGDSYQAQQEKIHLPQEQAPTPRQAPPRQGADSRWGPTPLSLSTTPKDHTEPRGHFCNISFYFWL